jgi:hypothetical protein
MYSIAFVIVITLCFIGFIIVINRTFKRANEADILNEMGYWDMTPEEQYDFRHDPARMQEFRMRYTKRYKR